MACCHDFCDVLSVSSSMLVDAYICFRVWSVWTLTASGVNAERGPPSKMQRSGRAHDRLQSFAQSAAEHYRNWESAVESGKAQDAGKVEEDRGKGFLTVSGDPFSTFPGGFLVWVRECYLDLKEILASAEAGMRFVLLGTSGIGKSYFSIFWICYLATMKKRVV